VEEVSKVSKVSMGLTATQVSALTPPSAVMQQTHQLRSAALSAFRSSASSLRAPANKRFFTPSAYNMTIKSYFDVSWEGPEVQVDQAGNVTSKGAAKSKFLLPHHVLHVYSFTDGHLSLHPIDLIIHNSLLTRRHSTTGSHQL
jgi:hypothetical protein